MNVFYCLHHREQEKKKKDRGEKKKNKFILDQDSVNSPLKWISTKISFRSLTIEKCF